MHKEILINVEPQERRIALLEGNVLQEFYVERIDIPRLLGNIYKGTVESIVPGIGAAFVEFGIGKNGFLYVSDIVGPLAEYEEMMEAEIDYPLSKKGPSPKSTIEDLLKVGQQVLVQVVREPIGTKGARLSAHISLPGRYLVLMPTGRQIGISRKIEDEREKERLKDLLKELHLPRRMGLIVRTRSVGAGKKEFARDIKYLINLWHRIKSYAQRRSSPSLIHEEYGLVLRVIRDLFGEDIDKLIVDSKDEYRKIAHFLNLLLPHLKSKLELYQGEVPLFEKYNLEKAIEKIYNRKVFLKSGGHIVIEQTEGLVAIDVNTGKFTGKRTPEETAFTTNSEAAREIARQVRLRDVGGIIVVDFIDMESGGHRKKVFDTFQWALSSDRAKIKIFPLSEIGLVEMTRERKRLSLESASFKVCPYCRGRGSVRSVMTMSIQTLRQIKRYFKETGKRQIRVCVHPTVAARLLNEDRGSISSLENWFKGKIKIEADPDLHVEDIKIGAP